MLKPELSRNCKNIVYKKYFVSKMDRNRVRVQARTVAPDQNEIMPYSYVVFTDQTYHSLMEQYLDRTGMHDDNVIWRTSDLRP